MKLKLVEINGKKYAEVDGENPVYVHDDGKEIAFDAKATVSRISALNNENKTFREGKEAVEAQLAVFAGIDPAAAKKALDTMKNIDESKLIDAGKVQEIKDAANRSAQEAVAAANAENSRKLEEEQKRSQMLTERLNRQTLGTAFGQSKYINEKLVLPTDLALQSFGNHFKVEEDGSIAAYQSDGKTRIYSRKDHGTPAMFEEAIEIIVDSYPHKDRILKATGSGSGSRGGGGGGGGGDDLSKLPPVERMKAARSAGRR